MKRLPLLLSTPIIGLINAVLCSAPQTGGPPGSPDLLPQNLPTQNPYIGVGGEGQLLDQLAGPFANRPKPIRIIDEISDPGERKAFETLHQKLGPQQRLAAAQHFLEDCVTVGFT